MQRKVVAIIGGAGDLGSGLALRWALAGHEVVIGTRDDKRGRDAADRLLATLAERGLTGIIKVAPYGEAAAAGEIVVSTVRFQHQRETLEQVRPHLEGKVLIDTTVPLVPPKVMRVQLPPEGSAAQIAQALLGPGVRVVSAFQNVAAFHLHAAGEVPCDVIVTGDDRAAREEVIALAASGGFRALHGGPLCNAVAAEALTSLLIFMNKEYRAHAGIRITGV